MRWVLCLALSLGATVAEAQTEEPSLAALAAKEKKRRKKVTDEGKASGQLMTNVMPSFSEEETHEVPKFQSLVSYERALDRTVDKFYSVCRDFAGASVVCSGAPRGEALGKCKKGTEGYKYFLGDEFQKAVRSRWNHSCTEAYETTQKNLELVRNFYDQLYQDYEKLAAEKGKSREIISRELPSN